jgi:4-diphosphocytidyl-2-C-methyl-D-erythritol kinase
VITFPNAKINIGLHVLEKRADGFHNIETVFYPVSWCDVLEIEVDENIALRKKNPRINFKATGIETYSQKEKNLVVRAYRLLEKDFPLKPVRMQLHKIIPIGAGLGGGSSDAAFAIKLLNKIFSLGLSSEQMIKYAGILGSDCAFFIENKPAYAKGKGDVLEPIKINLDKYFITLVKPDLHISTAAAYSKVTSAIPSQPLNKLLAKPVETWKQTIKNDFEESAFAEYPELQNIKQKLYDKGAVYASMSGSGSSMYGIFSRKTDLKKIFPGHTTWSSMLSEKI